MSASPIWLVPVSSVVTRRLARRSALAVALALIIAVVTSPAAAHAEGSSPVSISTLSPAEVEQMLSSIPLKDLSASQLGEVLAGHLGESPTSGLTGALERAIAGLSGKEGTLGQLAGSSALASELEKQLDGLSHSERVSLEGVLGLLGGKTLSSVLGEALGSLDTRQLVGVLLEKAGEPGQQVGPEQLIEQVLTAPSPEKLEKLLSTTLTGQPFSTGTVEELASQDGTTTKALAEDFAPTAPQTIQESTMALTAPLSDGKTLGVLNALEGIDIGTLTHELPGGSGGSGGSGAGSGGGPGGSGGAGGTSSSGAPGGTTVVEEMTAPSAAAAAKSAAASAKVKVVSHKVKGDAVTLVVQVPAAGRLTIAGAGVGSADRQAEKAERLTVRLVLKRPAVESLRRHRRLEVKLDVSFRPVSGAGSTAVTSIRFG
jgi:hypothetical protein